MLLAESTRLLSHAFVPSLNTTVEAMSVDRSRLLGCTFIRDVLLHRCKEYCQAGLGVPFHPRQVAVVHSPLEKFPGHLLRSPIAQCEEDMFRFATGTEHVKEDF